MAAVLGPLTFTIVSVVMTIISLSVAITKPLVSLSGYYDLHLFPEQDLIDYEVSHTHKISQIMHITALIFAALSLLSLLLTLTVSNKWSDRAQQDLTVISTVTTIASTATYTAGIATLVRIAMDYKHMADDMPLPTPSGHMEAGGSMDITGFIFSVIAAVLMVMVVVRTKREGYIRLF